MNLLERESKDIKSLFNSVLWDVYEYQKLELLDDDMAALREKIEDTIDELELSLRKLV